MHLFSGKNKVAYTFIVLLLLLAACAPAEAEPEATATLPATSTPSATASPTEVPPTPTATVSLPVKPGTPVPSADTAITSETVTQIQEFASYHEIPAYRLSADYFGILGSKSILLSMMDRRTLDRYNCELPLSSGVVACESYGSDFVPGMSLNLQHLLEVRQVLGTDGHLYRVELDGDIISITDSETGAIFDTFTFRQYIFVATAIDPANQVALYQIHLNMNESRIIIRDVENDRNIAFWEGPIYATAFAISPDGRYLALCKSNSHALYKYYNTDDLLIYDLKEKVLVRELRFDCTPPSMAFSPDGEHLAIQHYYVRDVSKTGTGLSTGAIGIRTTILNTASNEKLLLDIDPIDIRHIGRAVSYSPDGSLLAMSCAEDKICFIDRMTNESIHEIHTEAGTTNIIFSQDGGVFAVLSNEGVLRLWAIRGGN